MLSFGLEEYPILKSKM